MKKEKGMEVRSWDQVSIRKYFELKGLTGEESAPEIYGLLNDMSAEEVMDMPVGEMMGHLRTISFITGDVEPVKNIPSKITLRGKEYKVLQDCSHFKTGQFIDYQNFVTDRERYYANLLTTIIIPVKGEYGEGYDPLELAEIIREDMSITLAEGIYFFFARKSRKYMKRTLAYLRSVLKVNRTMGTKRTEAEKREKMKEAEKELRNLSALIDGFQL